MAGKRPHLILNLLRCGETRWESELRMHGASDLPMSDAGREMVRRDVARLAPLKLGTISHSPDEASTETAKILSGGASARTRPVDDLRDPDLGLLEGLLVSDFAERYPKRRKQWEEDPLSLIPPEGEPIAAARARIFKAMAKLLKKSRGGEVTVVLPPMGLGLLRCWLADEPANELWRLLETRPRVERYVLAPALADRLRESAKAEAVES